MTPCTCIIRFLTDESCGMMIRESEIYCEFHSGGECEERKSGGRLGRKASVETNGVLGMMIGLLQCKPIRSTTYSRCAILPLPHQGVMFVRRSLLQIVLAFALVSVPLPVCSFHLFDNHRPSSTSTKRSALHIDSGAVIFPSLIMIPRPLHP